MAERERQEVTGRNPPWKPEKEGDSLEGTYKGFVMVPDGRKGTFASFQIELENGNTVGISGAVLESKFKRIPQGTFVWIVYVGTIKTANGKAHDFKVDVEKGTKLLEVYDNKEDNIPF